jgi:MFS family permease
VLNKQSTSAPTSPLWLVLLMALGMFINYADRGNLGTVGSLVQSDLNLTATKFGLLGSAFYVTYVIAQFPAGWLADRYGAKLILFIGAAIWSLTTLLTGFAVGFISLLLLRLLLGVGESVGFTTTSKLIATSVPGEHVALANGVLGCGYLIGPAFGTLIGGMMMSRVGWRPVFFVFGACSMLWLILWSRVRVAEVTQKTEAATGVVPTVGQILRERGLWGAALGHFCGNYNFYFILYWLPTYLVDARHFATDKMAWIASSAYAVNSAAALLAGWAIDRWVRRGGSRTFANKLPMGLAHVTGIVCMAGIVVLPDNLSIASLFIYEIFLGFSSPGYFSIPQIMGGPTAAARWVGVQNSIGNIPGIIALTATGMLVDATGTYVSAFALAGVVNLIGFIGWIVILPKIEPVDWAARAAARAGRPPTSRLTGHDTAA